ncbi:hypothetical protein L7F22_007644 [Adiantum nelumboides]|nr:hypothetical protein [Adiantum nelumboides]
MSALVEVAISLVVPHMPILSLDKCLYEPQAKKSSVYAFGKKDNNSFCRLITRGLELRVKVSYSIDTPKGLEYLHHQSAEDIEHFDVKPANILLDEDFHARFGDFGLAKLVTTKALP